MTAEQRAAVEATLHRALENAGFSELWDDGTRYCSDSNRGINVPKLANEIDEALGHS